MQELWRRLECPGRRRARQGGKRRQEENKARLADERRRVENQDTPLRVSMCRYWMCKGCTAVFEKEDLEAKILLYSGPGQRTIVGTRECEHCRSIYQARDIYAGLHDVPCEHWGQLPGPAMLEGEEAEPSPQETAIDWNKLWAEARRWLALLGLPLLGCLSIMGAWKFHRGTGESGVTLILLVPAILAGSVAIDMGINLFAMFPRSWHFGATTADSLTRYGVLLGAVAAALLCVALGNGWIIRITTGILVVLFLLAGLADMDKDRRHAKGR